MGSILTPIVYLTMQYLLQTRVDFPGHDVANQRHGLLPAGSCLYCRIDTEPHGHTERAPPNLTKEPAGPLVRPNLRVGKTDLFAAAA